MIPDLADPDGVKESPDSSEMSTVAVSSDPETARAQSTCPICREDFDQFFKQKLDNSADDGCWHHANAVKVDDKVYHPACYKDFEAQGKVDQVLHQEVEMEDEQEQEQQPKAEDEVKVKGEAEAEVKDEKEDEAAGEGTEKKEGEVKEEPMETEESPAAAAAVPKENGENSEESGEKVTAETAGMK